MKTNIPKILPQISLLQPIDDYETKSTVAMSTQVINDPLITSTTDAPPVEQRNHTTTAMKKERIETIVIDVSCTLL